MVRASGPPRDWLLGFQAGIFHTIYDLGELLLRLAIDAGRVGVCGRLSEGEGGAHDGARHRGGIVDAAPARPRHIALVLLAVQMVVVGIFTVVRLLADGTRRFKRRFRSSGRGGCLIREHLLSEDLGGQRRERSNATLEVVATVRLEYAIPSRDIKGYLLPIGLHMRPLQLA